VSVNNYTVSAADQDLPDAVDFFYGGFTYAAWGMCVGWVILVCALGQGGTTTGYGRRHTV